MTDTSQQGDGDEAVSAPRTDWRTGKPMLQRDAAFWQDHEAQRQAQGLSVRAYCEANGLALSTYRHRAGGQPRSSVVKRTSAPAAATSAFIAIPAECAAPASAATIEIHLAEGLSVRLAGVPAERVLQRVLERLA